MKTLFALLDTEVSARNFILFTLGILTLAAVFLATGCAGYERSLSLGYTEPHTGAVVGYTITKRASEGKAILPPVVDLHTGKPLPEAP